MRNIYLKKAGPLLSYVESMIASGHFAPGKALPPQRQLSEEFGISRTLVAQAMTILAQRGLVEQRSRSGNYVLPQRKRCRDGKLRIGVVHEGGTTEQTYCAYVLAGIQERAAEIPDCTLEIWSAHYMNTFTAEALTQLARRSDALLLVGAYDRVLTEVPHCCPAVGVEMGNSFGGWVSLLSMDSAEAAERSAAYFQKHGVRHLHIIGAPLYPQHVERVNWMEMVWRNIGTFDHKPMPQDRRPDSGWWFSGGTRYHDFATRYFQKTGQDFARSHTVLSLDGKAFLLPEGAMMKCNALLTDWWALGRAALDETLRRARTPGTPARRISQSCSLQTIK